MMLRPIFGGLPGVERWCQHLVSRRGLGTLGEHPGMGRTALTAEKPPDRSPLPSTNGRE